MKLFKHLTTLLLFFTLPFAKGVESDTVSSKHTEAQLLLEHNGIAPGETFTVALRLTMDEHWHTYWENPGDAGLATEIEWSLPEGFSAGTIQWPAPKMFPITGIVNYGYEGTVYLLTDIQAPDSLMPEKEIMIHADVSWLECAEICIPGEASLEVTVPVVKADAKEPSQWAEAFKQARAALPAPNEDYRITFTEPDSDTVKLSIARKDNADQQSISHDLYFFSSDAQIVNMEQQPLERNEDGSVTLTLERSEYTDAQASLPGVLKFIPTHDEQDSFSIAIAPTLNDNAATAAATRPGDTSGKATGIAGLLALGFIGGLILNLMPCVFPIIGIKIMGFVNQAGEERKKVVAHGLLFTAGVLVSFWALAALLQFLRAGGQELGWGFQLQSPGFVFVLAAFLLVFALSMSGVFELGYSASGVGSKLSTQQGMRGTFFSGVLATVVATPCAAPFLAPALGGALTLAFAPSMLVFTAIALGLSTPYLLLSAFPQAINKLPKPGAWMETFKQALSFLLYGTVAFLLWTLVPQTDESGQLNALLALVALALACWVYGRWANPMKSSTTRKKAVVATLFIAAGALWFGFPPEKKATDMWQPWSEAKQEQLLEEGTPVYVDYTARWCATCQTNKRIALKESSVKERFEELGVATLKADWTAKDPAITQSLASYGRSAIPFNVLLLPDGKTIELPELLTPQIVHDALDKVEQ